MTFEELDNMVNTMNACKRMIKRHEGCVNKIYIDSRGYYTVGYGHMLCKHTLGYDHALSLLNSQVAELSGSGLTPYKIDVLFDRDFAEAVNGVASLIGEKGIDISSLSIERMSVLIDMCFNLGVSGLGNFKKMFAALRNRDYPLAAIEMKNSAWYTQVGNRSMELINIMISSKMLEKDLTSFPKNIS